MSEVGWALAGMVAVIAVLVAAVSIWWLVYGYDRAVGIHAERTRQPSASEDDLAYDEALADAARQMRSDQPRTR